MFPQNKFEMWAFETFSYVQSPDSYTSSTIFLFKPHTQNIRLL